MSVGRFLLLFPAPWQGGRSESYFSFYLSSARNSFHPWLTAAGGGSGGRDPALMDLPHLFISDPLTPGAPRSRLAFTASCTDVCARGIASGGVPSGEPEARCAEREQTNRI